MIVKDTVESTNKRTERSERLLVALNHHMVVFSQVPTVLNLLYGFWFSIIQRTLLNGHWNAGFYSALSR
jgi:hypothetical protein